MSVNYCTGHLLLLTHRHRLVTVRICYEKIQKNSKGFKRDFHAYKDRKSRSQKRMIKRTASEVKDSKRRLIGDPEIPVGTKVLNYPDVYTRLVPLTIIDLQGATT